VGERYFLPAEAIFRSAPADPTADFPTQMAKAVPATSSTPLSPRGVLTSSPLLSVHL